MPKCWVCGQDSPDRPMHYPCQVGVMKVQLKKAQTHLCMVKDAVEGMDTLDHTRTRKVQEIIRLAMRDLPSTDA